MVPCIKPCEKKKTFFEWILECDDRLTQETSIYGTGFVSGSLIPVGSIRNQKLRAAHFVKPIKNHARWSLFATSIKAEWIKSDFELVIATSVTSRALVSGRLLNQPKAVRVVSLCKSLIRDQNLRVLIAGWHEIVVSS